MLSLGDKEISTRSKTYEYGILAPKYNETRKTDEVQQILSIHTFNLIWLSKADFASSEIKELDLAMTSDGFCTLQDLNLSQF